ncbi:MAG TPA: alkaline phosphatase family protein [Gemmatimonadaceae bacterium]|nr:alkaline phosphatase family protein [Gemmatimonadaceae bacterium]
MSLVLILFDGARADAFDAPFARGELGHLARLRAEGGLHTITTVFPSVTGPAYAPFLTGRYPGPVGLPGLRWYDRARTRCRLPPYCRSYLGAEMRHMDRDLDPAAPTLFELAPSRFTAMSMISRGAHGRAQMGRNPRLLWNLARTHWRGDARAWFAIDELAARTTHARILARDPAITFLALLALDKCSHASGHASPDAHRALAALDQIVGALRADLERARRWDRTHLWIASDHGHAPVAAHDDLADAIRNAGHRVIAHPWVYAARADVAVMVSGNAMAHVYLDPAQRERRWWPRLTERWAALPDMLLERDSIDLLLLPHGADRCEVRARGRGTAFIERHRDRIAYRPATGDPLGLGDLPPLASIECHDATLAGHYPDALVQIMTLAGAPRAGDIIASAARGWDLRARYEPIPHVSTHGALLREHMLVPLLTNHPVHRRPRRTVDVMPSALGVLGLPVPPNVDGCSFV